MLLLVDMGNTRLKWAVWQESLVSSEALLNVELDEQVLWQCWYTFEKPDKVLVACVSGNVLLQCVSNVVLRLWQDVEVVIAHSVAEGFGVKNAYIQPERLGVDRWLALIAARQVYEGAVCVVDCGTAITIDLLTDEGEHLGGFISAGIGLMKQSLVKGTHALPLASQGYGIAAGCFTEAAIYSGTLLAAVGLIEQVLARQIREFKLVLTGGDAAVIAPHLSVSGVIDDELVLRGLAMLAQA